MSFEVHTFVSGPLSTNAHVVLCSFTREAWVVDAPHGSARVISEFLQRSRAKPKALILTHSHWDHIGDAHALQEALGIPVWIHSADEQNCIHPGSDGVPCWMPSKAFTIDRRLTDGEEAVLGDSRWKVLHTPGHTPGGICLWEPVQGLMVSGDTLFKGTYGRTDLTTGDEEKMMQSLKRLRSLPPETIIFPGHGPSTVLREEHWLHDIKSTNFE